MNTEAPPVKPPIKSVPAVTYGVVQEQLLGGDLLPMFEGKRELMERFVSVALHAVASDSRLLQTATPRSIVQAVKDSAALGLEPTGLGGEGAIVVYGDTATFMPMWRGYVKRIRNSGEVADIDVQVVYMNDAFELTLGTEPNIRHVPVLQPTKTQDDWRGAIRGVYAWAHMRTGKYIIEWMTTAEINLVRDTFAKGLNKPDSPWRTSWGEMARKTLIRRLSKRLPGSATEQLLRVDARADLLADSAHAASQVLETAPVRAMALAAVNRGSAPPTELAEEPETAQADSPQPKDAPPAKERSEEEVQLERQREAAARRESQ